MTVQTEPEAEARPQPSIEEVEAAIGVLYAYVYGKPERATFVRIALAWRTLTNQLNRVVQAEVAASRPRSWWKRSEKGAPRQ